LGRDVVEPFDVEMFFSTGGALLPSDEAGLTEEETRGRSRGGKD